MFVGCNKFYEKKLNLDSSKLRIVVSFNPLREFVEAIGKDKVDVQVIIPDGTEPHDFEPKAKDLFTINNADMFIYNGLNMESWVNKVVENVDNKNLPIVEASKGCNYIDNDPHVWLGITTAKVEVLNIKNELIKIDAKNKEFYEKNCSVFLGKLDSILTSYKPKFQSLNNKNFVTGHAAFAYFCRDFGLKQNSVEGVFAEGEPTPNKVKELVQYCRKNNVKTIFTEEMVSPKVSETLAKELNAEVKTIYTIESKESGKDYIECMEENIKQVYYSLK
nr:zinc ABC transporter substrate-binding protein [Clostridium rectalis]